ncbi:MAG: aldehyde ferredoxin oxidoreductase family protein [Syntrophobacterales bacterium]|nr:aldehyde ferredoxin oxidoreductase family protein [Syntrophobacterales bacterium]
MLNNDPLANVLYIDLSKRIFKVEKRHDLFEKYMGGTGVATALLHEECPENCDPLGPDNPVIFAVGPLTALFPLASKTVAMFKSPLTGNLGESHCGGRSAVAIRMAGCGAIVIKGASSMPVYLSIDGNQVYFRDASSLWGMGNFATGRIIRENETGAGLRAIMRIGRAGENLISYACVTSETYRHFGRLGLGAVFGSKKLKALVVSGKSSLPVSNHKTYRKIYDEVYKTAVDSPVMKKYHDLGTAENIMPLNDFGGLPTRNLKEARFEGASGISGETFAEQYLGRRLACSHCPVGCIHIAALREPYEDEAYFYKTSMISYDYEPIYSLGSMLGISSASDFLKLMDKVEVWGMDAMSLGVILAWATEARERGLISEKETGGAELEWGNVKEYIKAAGYIVSQPNDFYKALARGVEHVASIYGGENYALAFGGNEMPGYHTGPGAHLGALIGARHSHLDNGGYGVDQKTLVNRKMKPEELVDTLLEEERWRQVLSSLVVCFFARGIYSPELVARLLAVAGFDLSTDDLQRIGKEIHSEKYRFKIREGFAVDSVRIPERISETPSPISWLNESYLKEALKYAQKTISKEINTPFL